MEVCGWSVKNSISEDNNFERNAALAVWHGNIEEAVDILSRGSAFIRQLAEAGTATQDVNRPPYLLTLNYAEALDLLR